MSGAGPGRRVQAYTYTLVTTALVLVLALAEWAAERFVSDHSRVASTALEIAIVLVAALVFRPIHKYAEVAIEAAVFRRKHRALDALAKFRRELTSFGDAAQLLRRVVEAVEHYMEARASAVYVRRDSFRAEASTYDEALGDVPADDPLIVRLRSSGAPARLQQLKSAARGTYAFAVTAGGELTGVLCIDSKHADYDAQELQMLTGLAQDLGVALAALDPQLRAQRRSAPGNIPVDLPKPIGRDREIAELSAALVQPGLVTIAGPGGVGKTCVALQCAADAAGRRQDGAWFVNLAPLVDGTLAAATVLAALDAQGSDAGRLVEHLRPRDALIVVDNCEHVAADIVPLLAKIRANCPQITLLATSRELLHLDGEHVYRLGPLRTGAALELFERRAAAASPGFDAHAHSRVVRSICERLDGIPLAIELAAARVRSLNVDEISDKLHERFRLLTSVSRTALPRQQTLAALIEWSYDLLAPEERALFRRLSVFRGSFTLAAAAAVCADREGCDEFHVLDVLTALADKSLMNVTLALATRYHFLETIREFAAQKSAQENETPNARHRHAAYFSAAAAQAYHEFDTRLPEGWLEGLAPDIDNFRAALEWTLEGPGRRISGAQLAGDCGPIFLRMELLPEGLRWCEIARRVAEVPSRVAGRIDYVASMMHNNLGRHAAALECAVRAVEYYEKSSDERGLIRALSQTAQLYARAKRFDDAIVPAAEAVRRARSLGQPRVLAGVLRRCGYSLPPEEIDRARQYFSEALDVARAAREPEEVCMVLEWWAHSEADAGSLERAMELASEALQNADRGSLLSLEMNVTGWALARGDYEAAEPHAKRALELARQADNPLARALAIAYRSAFHAGTNASQAAELFAYAMAQLRELGWEEDTDDRLALENVRRTIEANLQQRELPSAFDGSAGWNEERVWALLT